MNSFFVNYFYSNQNKQMNSVHKLIDYQFYKQFFDSLYMLQDIDYR